MVRIDTGTCHDRFAQMSREANPAVARSPEDRLGTIRSETVVAATRQTARDEETGERVLVVEDDEDVRSTLCFRLEEEGYEAIPADCGRKGVDLALAKRPALMIVDLMLPDIDGTEVARRLAQNPETRHIPFMILSARTDEVDRVIAFELGATDFVTKPFSTRELMLRVRAILRRLRRTDTPDRLTAGPITVDSASARTWVYGTEVSLTAREFQLLETIVRGQGRVLSRAEILDAVWPSDASVIDRTVDSAVMRLRSKLGRAADVIQTVRGVGYRCNTALD